MQGVMELELVFYHNDFKQQLDNYTITDDQLRFTGHPDEAIALAKDDPERHPVVAIRHGRITNFFVLHEKMAPGHIQIIRMPYCCGRFQPISTSREKNTPGNV
ncbi:hypothetical protein [Heyndrickxia coagulans]|nr:hypothetical protein [Heyndrickxia coagulans]